MRQVICAVAIVCAAVSSAGADDSVPGAHSLAVYGGQATNTNFTESIFMPWTNDMKDIGVIAGAYNYRFGTVEELTGLNLLGLGDNFMIEGEAGLSARFGDESLGEAWVGAFLRYDGFFWNEHVYTTVAANTGVSLLTEYSDFERGRDSGGKNSKLLHFMAPEITFADPDHKNLELLVRYHHRSGVFGLFDGVVSGSTFITTGLRVRF
jgi:hypothetical protein